MPKFLITEHRNELRVYTTEIEADSKEAAELLYIEGNFDWEYEDYKDTIHSEYEIEELNYDAFNKG